MTIEKAKAIVNVVDEGIIIGSDTVTVKLQQKMAYTSIELLSNRRHRIYTGICIIKNDKAEYRDLNRVIKSILKFKKLSKTEINYYCTLKEGIGNVGGRSIQGYSESYTSFLSGSFSNIVGLPLFKTINMLNSVGFYVHHK